VIVVARLSMRNNNLKGLNQLRYFAFHIIAGVIVHFLLDKIFQILEQDPFLYVIYTIEMDFTIGGYTSHNVKHRITVSEFFAFPHPINVVNVRQPEDEMMKLILSNSVLDQHLYFLPNARLPDLEYHQNARGIEDQNRREYHCKNSLNDHFATKQ